MNTTLDFHAADLDRPTTAVASSPNSENSSPITLYSEPTIVRVNDLGDEDAYLWEIEAAYLAFRATAIHRDRSAAQTLAVDRVLEKARQA